VRKVPKFNFSIREQTVINALSSIDAQIYNFVNVGFHDWQDQRRHWWIKYCDVNNINWHIVEAFKGNVTAAVEKGCPEEKISHNIIEKVESLPEADCLMFWHGPEHLKKNDFLSILPDLERKYRVLIFGMPLGEEPQGPAYGNPYERHLSAWSTEEWKSRGYEVVEVHDRQKYPHITVYKTNF